MHKKLSLSVAMMVIGACLLVASSFAGAASAGAKKSDSSDVKRGGTLRLNASNTDFEFTDPALAYDLGGISGVALSPSLWRPPSCSPADVVARMQSNPARRISV